MSDRGILRPAPRARERVFVALGANLADPDAQVRAGIEALRAEPGLELVAASSRHRTGAVGGPPGQPDYANAVCELRTELEPLALLDRLLAIEARFGRDRAREARHGPRLLDLDLLLVGDRRVDHPRLTLPHPRLEERAFVLAPLAELAPDLRLPSGATVAERLAALDAAGAPR